MIYNLPNRYKPLVLISHSAKTRQGFCDFPFTITTFSTQIEASSKAYKSHYLPITHAKSRKLCLQETLTTSHTHTSGLIDRLTETISRKRH
ncbi:hypothetical protein [uncultured Helicobacter sp.]|uniref:hypothetical protein n=1 Tax=uncultured Helicobacter sp. TaxID=175537 RepID=UPI00262576C7|nr:hypothetical protein [uncultured Helicobacter sp.]